MPIFSRLSNIELPLETPGHNLKNAQKGAAFSARACVRALHEIKQAFLATSFAEGVADSFIARVPAEFPKVKWRIRIDPSRNLTIASVPTASRSSTVTSRAYVRSTRITDA